MKTKLIFQHVLTLTKEEGDNWFWKGDEPYCIKMPNDNVDTKHLHLKQMSFKVKRERNDQGVDEKSQHKFHDIVCEKRNGKGNWGSKIIEHNWTRYHIWWWISSRLKRQYHYFLLSMLQMARWTFWQGFNEQCVKFLEKEVHFMKANNI